MTTELYNIDGMSCAACSSAVERVTRKLPGVQSSDVNLTTAKMTITYDEAQVTPEQIMEKVKKAGFSATLVPKEKDRMEDEEEGAGLEAWLQLLRTDRNQSFESFLQSAGIASPFEKGRIRECAEFLESQLSGGGMEYAA